MAKKGNLLKTIIIIICIGIVVALMGYIGLNTINSKNQKEVSSSTNSKELTIDNFKEELIHNGIEIEEETTKIGSLIGAKEGYSYQINDTPIEVYKFDNDSKNELTIENIKMAKDKGKIKMPDFNNVEFNAIYNKGLIIINYEGHPLEEKIIEIFKSL